MTMRRKQIIEYIEQGHIPAEKIHDALAITKITPDNKAWLGFIHQLLLWLGGLALAFSAMFFIAYNWDDIGRFAKFGLVETLIVLSIVAYLKLDKQQIAAKISLLMATIFLGVILALYGMTYQTGADTWQLFFNWALLMLPWAILGRFPAIWVLWIGLINLSIVLYYGTFGRMFWFGYGSINEQLWIVFAFNALALIIWELLINRWQWLAERWAVRLLAIASGVAITWLVIFAIFDGRGHSEPWSGLIWMIFVAVMFGVYRNIRHDLFMLAGVVLSSIVVVICFVSRHILDNADAGGLLLIAMMIIGMGTGAAIWLKNVHREWQS